MGRLSKLENDCMEILRYASTKKGAWISLTELVEELNIPKSTVRNILAVSNEGVYCRNNNDRCIIHSDVFRKIATKYRYDYLLKKMRNKKNRVSWHISVVFIGYHTPNNNTDNIYSPPDKDGWSV